MGALGADDEVVRVLAVVPQLDPDAPLRTSGRERVSENSFAPTDTKVPSAGAWAAAERARGAAGRLRSTSLSSDARAAVRCTCARFPCLRVTAIAGQEVMARSATAATAIRPASGHQRRASEAGRVRDDRRRVHAEPLLEQRAVDAAEVRRVAKVVVLVEHGQAGELADHLARHPRADQEARARRAVVRARAVLLRPAAELAPDVDDHAVVDPRASRSRWKARRLSPISSRSPGRLSSWFECVS